MVGFKPHLNQGHVLKTFRASVGDEEGHRY